ncbi:hypothetical protein BKA63DRAFT_601111 [Paraphoma chrysanthemicola]|nr:hypothetical protein BKA63DRAFT_601111 [Paraphoma chrysanthemicola]
MPAPIRVPRAGRKRVKVIKLPKFVEANAGEILKIWKAANTWKQAEKDGDAKVNDRVVQVALRWLAAPLKIIPEPDIGHRGRRSEEYFTVWAHTREGRKRIKSWTRLFPCLKYKRNFPKLQIQRFLRELLTTGTNLNRRIKTGSRLGLETKEMMAIALLRSRTRRLSQEQLKVSDEIEIIVQEEDRSFDDDFPVVGHNENGCPIYHLALGRENSILSKRLYTLGRVGYYDIKPAKKERKEVEEYALRMVDLPDELKLKIVNSLFKLETDIQVILRRSGQGSAPPFKYNFLVWGPEDDPEGAPPLARSETEAGPIKNIFALAEVNKKFRGLVLQVFYGEKRFWSVSSHRRGNKS